MCGRHRLTFRPADLRTNRKNQDREHADGEKNPDPAKHVTIKPLNHKSSLQIIGHLVRLIGRQHEIPRQINFDPVAFPDRERGEHIEVAVQNVQG